MTDFSGSRTARNNGQGAETGRLSRIWHWLRGLLRGRNGDSALRDTIEEIIEEIEEAESEEASATPISDDERVMLANLLKQRHRTTYDVMVPRADIVAVEVGTSLQKLLKVMGKVGHSRLPVYRGTLDDVVGLVHIKDVLPLTAKAERFKLESITRRVLFAAPSMRVLDLLLEMRESRVHMALVVDEFGGIDGLITIEDLVEEIVGEIEDEHDVDEGPKLTARADGSLVADGRTTVEEFEERVGPVLSDEEREEDIDTLGGLVAALAGRVPTRGELLVHSPSGISFEVIQADPRRVKRLRVRNLPPLEEAAQGG
ncbi:MAG: hemolysin family protein [Rhodospirillales bacterium]|nr:hemolysin family protein [Rhodospirillales bacterium]MDH3790806.1 hemolysin family protein [Rhodospirillales bacterium]MDH3911096.1 hemolysin family protein [Rhodospirillales bacterium]MDH3965429.1 hemolysin family protein [Rhodospirillales bacterium]